MLVPTPKYSTVYHNNIFACLERHGYRLDDRYPAKVAGPPSKTHKQYQSVSFAVRIRDAHPVVVKIVGTQNVELKALRLLSSEPLASDPRNHCIRILDSFPAEDDTGLSGEWSSFVVLPVYRKWYDPPMHLVAEAIPFIHQLLEGLAFLHDHNIAHGSAADIKSINVLMDMHLGDSDTVYDGQVSLKAPSSHLESRPRYVYIDFGDCTIFDSFEARHLVGVYGGTFRLPENPRGCRPAKLVDVFKADIWLFGHMLCTLFGSRTRIPFIDPLINRMHSRDPKLRPTAQESLDLFQDIVGKMAWSLTIRLPNAYLTTYHGTDESKWPARRAEDSKEYIQRLIQFLVLTDGSPRIAL